MHTARFGERLPRLQIQFRISRSFRPRNLANLGSKIRFWIRRKEHTLKFKISRGGGMPPNPPSNSRLPRLAVWSGYGTGVWLIRYIHCKLIKLTFFVPLTKNGIFKLTKCGLSPKGLCILRSVTRIMVKTYNCSCNRNMYLW